MSYQALYRRFRPTRFEDVIGQEHITTTLTNQIKSGRIAHAYLFCGTRGTGKTTCAKIFARAINCERPVGGSPCNECETCRTLLSGASVDVNEIDAASNNGVDEIREIKENVQYTPTVGKYKVYIVDEVHMLSQAAFNALLKTLEEPPKHAVFILATTESHKLPATILSRCMRFDFKLVGDELLAGLLRKIFTEISVGWEEDALKLIARAGEGSVRDTLTIADTCVSYCGEKVDFSRAAEVIGVTDKGAVIEFADFMLGGDVGKVFELSSELFARGKAVSSFHRDVMGMLRDFCVILSTKNAQDLLTCSKETFAEMTATAKKYSIGAILNCIDILAAAENEIKFSLHPRILFEAAAMRCAKIGANSDLETRLAKLEALVSGGRLPAASAPVRPAPIPNAPARELPQTVPARPAPIPNVPSSPIPPRPASIAEPPVEEPAESETGTVADNPKKLWGTVVRTLREKQNGLLYTICGGLSCETEGSELTVIVSSEQEATLLGRENNRKALEEILFPLGIAKINTRKRGENKPAEDSEMKQFETLLGEKLVKK